MKFSRTGLLLLPFVTLLFAGCMGGPKIGGITVTALSLTVGTSPAEVRAPLVLHFANENVVPLGYSGSVHKLYINGTYVGKATNQEPIGLPPMNAATREIYLQFDNPKIASLLAAGGSQSASYRLDSVLYQTAGDDKLEIKTRSEGNLELRAGAN